MQGEKCRDTNDRSQIDILGLLFMFVVLCQVDITARNGKLKLYTSFIVCCEHATLSLSFSLISDNRALLYTHISYTTLETHIVSNEVIFYVYFIEERLEFAEQLNKQTGYRKMSNNDRNERQHKYYYFYSFIEFLLH